MCAIRTPFKKKTLGIIILDEYLFHSSQKLYEIGIRYFLLKLIENYYVAFIALYNYMGKTCPFSSSDLA